MRNGLVDKAAGKSAETNKESGRLLHFRHFRKTAENVLEIDATFHPQVSNSSSNYFKINLKIFQMKNLSRQVSMGILIKIPNPSK